jgi:hypothetical protein
MLVNIQGLTGKEIVVGVALYMTETDELRFVFPDGFDKEEGIAILRKFHCLPLDEWIKK